MIKDPQALITDKKNWGDYYLFSLKSAEIASLAQPGQFIMVRPGPHYQPLLRRPFSLHFQHKKNIQIFFKITGKGTRLLSQKKPGDCLDVIGPLGKGFSIEAETKRKVTALVAGGRGIAPLYFLAHRLRQQGAQVKIFYGGQSRWDLPLKNKIETDGFELYLATDDGSLGLKGFVAELFKQKMKKVMPFKVYACGPEAMMAKIAHLLAEEKIPAEYSLESIMGCGFGACWGCVRKIKRQGQSVWLKTCQEGPVFSGEEIIWADGKS